MNKNRFVTDMNTIGQYDSQLESDFIEAMRGM